MLFPNVLQLELPDLKYGGGDSLPGNSNTVIRNLGGIDTVPFLDGKTASHGVLRMLPTVTGIEPRHSVP